ncbi:ATP-binding cassette domain-containing protein [Nocardia yamanashiensis]|uniref:ABC transporter ATP-binding protein n=1 Tax=Nocardia yamanashiensis TaxID=209247 RepID=UPI001E4F333E|nr:ATP-binding cassette domain-containing protein [Nocardia yamanashiensis]UGT44223.1 ATP-binding cassette domain-containing protein [Nocardia yamanashiensis]
MRSASGAQLLAPTSLQLPSGSVTALAGPSGSGKTTLMRAILGHLPVGAIRVGGTVHVADQDVFALKSAALQHFRRRHLALVTQDPGAALNPRMRIDALFREAAPRSDAAAVLDRVGLPSQCLRKRSGELSGGEQRRLALALAIVREVGVLIADEPLAGLHARLRTEIAELLRSLASDDGVTVLVSGHDTEVLHRVADTVIPLGTTRPRQTQLIATASAAAPGNSIALRGNDLRAWAGRRTLLDSVAVDLAAGESVAVVGPSGAGKTTLARVLAGIHRESRGSLEVAGRPVAVGKARRSRRDRRRVQLIPQDPLSTLNPKHTVGQALSRPLRLNGMTGRAAITERAAELLADVDLDRSMSNRYPDELSGGQRQRVAIARALAAEPDVLICDEITSALDAATAASIMDLLEHCRITRHTAVLVVSHDMTMVARHCSRILVLSEGRVVERGDTAAVLAAPTAPETRSLLV